MAASRCDFCACSMALSTTAISCARRPMASMAPLLISDSITRLFSRRRSTFSQNWKIDLNAPDFLARRDDGLDGIVPDILDRRRGRTGSPRHAA